MPLKIYKNHLSRSAIEDVVVYVLDSHGKVGPAVTLRMRYRVFKEISQNQLANFLNLAADIGGDGSKRVVTEELEQALVKDFREVIDIQNGKYVYVGPGTISVEESYRFIEEKYKAAPKFVTKVSNSCAKADTGQLFPLGLVSMRIKLDVQKLGGNISDQLKLDEIVVDVAREFTLLPHLQYRKSIMDKSSVFGTMPTDYFDCISSYVFKSQKIVMPSDAIESIFRPQEVPLITECAAASQIIHYKAALDFLGKAEFNKLFAEQGIIISKRAANDNPISQKRSRVHVNLGIVLKDYEKKLAEAQPGDILYVSNVAPYTNRHYWGDSQGFNICYLGKNDKGQYEFGSLFTNKKIHTYDEIIDLLIADYNKMPYGIKEGQVIV